MAKQQNENPPSYDDLAPASTESHIVPPADVKHIPAPSYTLNPHMDLGSSSNTHNTVVTQPGHFPSPTVYHYVHPTTQERITSLLPPDHPEMVCLQAGEHVPVTRYGILGIMAAILWFPLGVGLCLMDRRVKCSRCGHLIDEGICN